MSDIKKSKGKSIKNLSMKQKQNKPSLKKSKQIHMDISMETYKEWERYRIENKFTTMTGMIVRIMQNTISPPLYFDYNNEMQAEIENFKRELQTINQTLGNLYQEKDQIIAESQQSNPQLEERILNYLKKSGKANEYVIASDLNENTEIVFYVLCYLKEHNKITQDKMLNWEILL